MLSIEIPDFVLFYLQITLKYSEVKSLSWKSWSKKHRFAHVFRIRIETPVLEINKQIHEPISKKEKNIPSYNIVTLE